MLLLCLKLLCHTTPRHKRLHQTGHIFCASSEGQAVFDVLCSQLTRNSLWVESQSVFSVSFSIICLFLWGQVSQSSVGLD